MGEHENIPTPEQMKGIWKDTYNWFLKCLGVVGVNWDEALDEMKVIEKLYPFEICKLMLLGIVDVLEAYHRANFNNTEPKGGTANGI